MLLRVLGPLEVLGRDGPVPLGAAKPRALLAALAIGRGTTSTSDDLIDALWGESPPPSAPKLLQVYVSQLRKALPAGLQIVTGATGYALEVDPDDVDAVVFERLVGDGHAALRTANPALAASTLARALALWRGPAFADVRYEPFALEEIERLEQLREQALIDRVDADLRLGRHAEVLGELRGVLAADPIREDIAARAMLAAYRTAGPGEALGIFATLQAALLRELGEEPNEELAVLRDRVAQRDPSLDLAPGEQAVIRAGPALPVAPNPLIGRRRELAELRTLLARPGVRFVSLTGAGGSGKSRLALELAHDVEAMFANGAVLVELASLSDPGLVSATIARAFGLEPGLDPMTKLREALATREVLLVLDNLEHLRDAAGDLVGLLAAAPRLIVLATTRVVLHVSGEHVYPVAPLTEADALALFVERAQAQDPSFALDASSEAAIHAICHRLDGLPLPIELAAARVRALGLRTLSARLASRLTVLTGGPRDLPARQRTLRETLAWSVGLLDPRQTEILASLAVFPAGCTMEGAAAVASADDDSMVALVDHHLVQALEVDGERRFRLLETVREYGYELLGPRRDVAESALASWMVELAGNLNLVTASPSQVEAMRLLDTEVDTLRDSFRHAARDPGPDRELALASSTWSFWWVRGYLAEGRAIFDGILERRGLVPTQAGIRTARAAASLAWSMGDVERAEGLGREALEVARRVGDILEQMSVLNLLGIVARVRRALDDAAAHLSEAISLAESQGNLELVNMYRVNLGAVDLDAGRINDARQRFLAALDYYDHSEGQSRGIGHSHLNLGDVEFHAGNLAEAESHFEAAADAFRAVGFKVRLANSLQGLAAVEAHTGRSEAAARRLGSAAALIGEIGWAAGDSDLEPAATSAAREALGAEAFDRLFSEGLSSGAA